MVFLNSFVMRLKNTCEQNPNKGTDSNYLRYLRLARFHAVKWKMGVWSVENEECGKYGVWKIRSVERLSGKRGVWKMWSVENAECRKWGVWKMRSVKEKKSIHSQLKRLYHKKRQLKKSNTFWRFNEQSQQASLLFDTLTRAMKLKKVPR